MAQSFRVLSSGSELPLPVESGNQAIRLKIANDARQIVDDTPRRVAAERDAERERIRVQAEREYSKMREAARAAIAVLPHSDDKQQLLDEFSCTYPPAVKLPPSALEVAECLRTIGQARADFEKTAAAKRRLQSEEEQMAEARRNAERELQAIKEQEEEQRLLREARAMEAAAMAAQESGREWARNSIGSALVAFFGLLAIVGIGVSGRKAGVGAVAAAIVTGFCAALIVHLMTAVIVIANAIPLTVLLVLTILFAVWALTTHVLLRGAARAADVLAQGLLVVAIGSLLMVPLTIVFGGAVADGGLTYSRVVVPMVRAIFPFLTPGFCAPIAAVCAIGFAVSHFAARASQADAGSTAQRCRHCGESVGNDALKCRFCGAALGTSTAPPVGETVFSRIGA